MIETAALNVPAGQRAGAEIAAMDAGQRPTAVFCANDLVALGLLQEMTRQRIRVPDDVAIVGYDDIEFAAAAAVPLSSVRQPRQQLGRTAAQLLLEESLGDGRAPAPPGDLPAGAGGAPLQPGHARRTLGPPPAEAAG